MCDIFSEQLLTANKMQLFIFFYFHHHLSGLFPSFSSVTITPVHFYEGVWWNNQFQKRNHHSIQKSYQAAFADFRN